MMLISSCLVGLCSTYRGAAHANETFERLVAECKAIPFCPEQLGGLATPRDPAEIVGGEGCDVLAGRVRVITKAGADVTANYLRGAEEVLKLARIVRPELIILKERSPSCGVREIHDGTFSGNIIEGSGVTTALLLQNGFAVISDESYLGQR